MGIPNEGNFPVLFEKSKPEYDHMWSCYSKAMRDKVGKEMIEMLNDSGLKLASSVNISDGDHAVSRVFLSCHAKNPYSLKASRLVLSKVHLLDTPSKKVRLWMRIAKVRHPHGVAAWLGSDTSLFCYPLISCDVDKFPELVNVFGRGVNIHMTSFHAYSMTDRGLNTHAIVRNMVVPDHFIDRFVERVLPGLYLTRYSDKEAAFVEFMTCGPRYWGARREYAYATHLPTKTLVEAYKIDGMPIVYFFGHGETSRFPFPKIDGFWASELSGFTTTCMTENDLTPHRRRSLEMLNLTSDTWAQCTSAMYADWMRKPNERILSEGSAYGRN